MLEFVRDLRNDTNSIIEQARRNSYERAISLVEKHGYKFEGLTEYVAIHFSRDTYGHNYEKAIGELGTSLRSKGFDMRNFNISIGRRSFNSYVIARTYMGYGGAPIVEDAPDVTKGIVSITYHDEKIIMGVAFNISDQHIDVLQEVAEKFGMEPIKPRTPISKKEQGFLEKLLGDIEL